MGAVANVVKKAISWIGNCIETVISWWSPHKERVNKILLMNPMIHMLLWK